MKSPLSRIFRNYTNLPVDVLLHSRWFRLFVLEAYMNAGFAKMGILRYSVFGAFMADFQGGFVYMVAYAVAAYMIGRWMYKKGLIFIQAEVGNQFNRFQKELRSNSK